MDTAEMSFGKFVRKVRRDRDMTQEELAAYLGVTRGQIANIEAGKTSGVRGFRTLFYERMGIQPDRQEPKPPEPVSPPSHTLPPLSSNSILLEELKAVRSELGHPLLKTEIEAWAAAKEDELLTESALLREALELRTKRELLAAAKASRRRWEAKAHGK